MNTQLPGRYKVGSSTELVAYIYFYSWTTKLVISDIDGTITRSDVLGHLLPAMGWDWSHAGITRLFTDIMHNSYQVRVGMYVRACMVWGCLVGLCSLCTCAHGWARALEQG